MLIEKFQVLPSDRSFLGAIFIFFSLGMSGLSYLIYDEPKMEPSFKEKQSSDMKACSAFAKHKGFDVEEEGSSVLVLTTTRLDDPKFLFSSVESIILACDNLKLESFCLGEESQCSLFGTKMVFSYEKPDAV
jgi:hypothetical protein